MRNPGSTRTRQIWQQALLLAWLVPSCAALAAEVEVEVLDRDGHPVPGVVVYAPGVSSSEKPRTDAKAVMDQVDTAFVPHVLVIQEGTLVEFPNSDPVAHHVYSFSKPNDFMLPLYKGDTHAPVRFEDAGLVTLGCNIHDHMLGYILVVDTAAFAETNESGRVVLDIGAATDTSVSIWSPRIRSRNETLTLPANSGEGSVVTFRLDGKLRPAHGDNTGGVQWTDY